MVSTFVNLFSLSLNDKFTYYGTFEFTYITDLRYLIIVAQCIRKIYFHPIGLRLVVKLSDSMQLCPIPQWARTQSQIKM